MTRCGAVIASPSKLPPPDGPAQGADVTREKLLQAAHELLYERMGGNASVSEICTRAKVNVAMVKYCFGSKDGLLDALVERVSAQFPREIERLAQTSLSPSEKLRRHVGEIVRNYFRYPYFNRVMNQRLLEGDPDAVQRMSRSFSIPTREWYRELLAEGREREGWREIDPTLFLFSVVGICEFIFAGRPWLEQTFDQPMDAALVERFVEHVSAIVVAGVQPEA